MLAARFRKEDRAAIYAAINSRISCRNTRRCKYRLPCLAFIGCACFFGNPNGAITTAGARAGGQRIRAVLDFAGRSADESGPKQDLARIVLWPSNVYVRGAMPIKINLIPCF